MEASALRKRGWSISAIARHLGRDRKTVRAHLNGERRAGERARRGPDPFDEFIPYLRKRFADDVHVQATALFDEVVGLGFTASYPTFTRGLRRHGLRPHCEACSGVKGRATIEIEHPPGEEIQWDWNELGEAPWGVRAYLLLGTLPFSGRTRGYFSDSMDQAHLIEAMDAVVRRLGGTARRWRVDRMATVINPATGEVQASFVPVAKHYGVTVVPCPPRRGNRKGAVEKGGVHFSSERFWRTMTAKTRTDAQVAFDRFCSSTGDGRLRPSARLVSALGGEEQAAEFMAARGRRRPTVADLADLEPLMAIPAVPYPATVEVPRTVGPSWLVAFEGNRYSVPDGLAGAEVTVRHRLGTETVEVVSAPGLVLVRHRRATPGVGAVVRDPAHRQVLEHEVLAAFSTAPPCRRKANRPPGEAARVEAAKLLGVHYDPEVVVSLETYQAIVDEETARRKEARS